MEGMVECAEEILGMPVRLGFPVGVKGIVQLVQGPQYATGVGLLRYGAQQLADRAHTAQAGVPQGGRQQQELAEQAAQAGGKNGFWNWFRAAF
jgi:cell division protein FtsA